MNSKRVTGIVSKNSIKYVEAIFDCYKNDETVVLLRDKDDSRIALTGVSKVIDPTVESGWFKKHYQFRDDDGLAQIAFTSGTEGEPKGVLLTHQALADVTVRLNDIMDVDASIREYVGIPANFSFGLGRFRAVSAAGGEAFLPANGFDPIEIRDMLAAGEINAVSAVPSLWRILLKNKQIFAEEAKSLKWIEIGSQYMSRSEKEELVSLFPNAKIAQHYGLTEASRSSFLRLDQTKGEHLESVGKAYGATEFKISERGRICIRGPHVSKTLLKSGDYISNVDSDGWFETSDLGKIEDGYLYYGGRADDLINCGGIKLSPDALEREVRESLNIKEGIAIAAVHDDLTGHAVLVAHKEDIALNENDLHSAAFSALQKFGINNKNVIKLLSVESFPVTSTNKVRRKELAAFYREAEEGYQPPANSNCSSNLTVEEADIAAIWADVLKLKHVDPDKNFYDLGGDSLSAIGALVAMESKGVPKAISKGMLQGFTVREIAYQRSFTKQQNRVFLGHEIRSESIKNTMTISIVRGVMVLLVIFAHWHQGLLERVPGVNVDVFTKLTAPVLSMATPGFAVIYGVGAGYSLYPLFEKDPVRLTGIFKKTALFLISGITLLALIVFWSDSLKVDGIASFTSFTNSFYSVLTFYLLASLTLFFWFRLVHRSPSPIVTTVFLAVLMYVSHYFVVTKLSVLSTTGVLELMKLLFTGKYAYFLMLSGTFVGLAFGLSLQKLKLNSQHSLHYLFIALILILAGVTIWHYVYDMDPWDYWPIRDNYIWRWLTYSGVVLLLLVITEKVLRRYDEAHPVLKFSLQSFSIIGMLAFPLFVLHEIVMPSKDILIFYGVPETLGLVMMLLFFFSISFIMFRKLHAVSYLND